MQTGSHRTAAHLSTPFSGGARREREKEREAATEWAASAPSCGHSLFPSHAETSLVIGLIVGEHELGVGWVISGVFTSKYRLRFDGARVAIIIEPFETCSSAGPLCRVPTRTLRGSPLNPPRLSGMRACKCTASTMHVILSQSREPKSIRR